MHGTYVLTKQESPRGRIMKMHHDGYRIVLEHKAEDLRWSLRRRGEIPVERAAEPLEDALLATERESATQELERTSSLLRQVEAALTRLRTANYGSCLKCGLAIPEKRLNAVPWAMYCVDCQELVDRLHAQVKAFRMPAA